MNNDRDFKGIWIPREIWLNPELSALDRVMLAEISSLDNENHCTASNEYFAEFCSVSVPTITRCIKKLKDMGFIDTEMVNSKTGSYRLIKMIIGSNQNDERGIIKMISNYNSNTNNKVVSKDTTSNPSFEFGKQKVSNKKSLYQKCIDLILAFSNEDEKLKNMLIQYLNLLLEKYKSEGKTLYENQFKGMLNKLAELEQTNNIYDVIQQSISKGYISFYPVNNSSNFNNPDSNKSQQKKADLSNLSNKSF